ncbi:MAG: hypothetical protein PHE53_06945 [Thermoguttaceae bacterium]|nr:hypothetical protein [Thermoguttaceae bacterium]
MITLSWVSRWISDFCFGCVNSDGDSATDHSKWADWATYFDGTKHVTGAAPRMECRTDGSFPIPRPAGRIDFLILLWILSFTVWTAAAWPAACVAAQSSGETVVPENTPLTLPPPPSNVTTDPAIAEIKKTADIATGGAPTKTSESASLASETIATRVLPVYIPRANLVFTPGDTLEIHAGPCVIPATETWPMWLEWEMFAVDPLTGTAGGSVLASGETTVASATEMAKLSLPISMQEGLIEIRLALLPVKKRNLLFRNETASSSDSANSGWNPLEFLPAKQFFTQDAVQSRSFRILVLSQSSKIPAEGRKSASANRAKSLTERYTPTGFTKVVDPESAEFAVVVAEFDPNQPAVNITKNARWTRPDLLLPTVPKFKLPEWKNPFQKQPDDQIAAQVPSAPPATATPMAENTDDSGWTYWPLEHLIPGQPHWIEISTDTTASFAVCVMDENSSITWGMDASDAWPRQATAANPTTTVPTYTSAAISGDSAISNDSASNDAAVSNSSSANGSVDSASHSRSRRYRFLFWATSERGTLAIAHLANQTPVSYQAIRLLAAPDGIAIPAKTVRSGKRLILADFADPQLPVFLGAGASENGEWPANERLLETLRYANYDGLIRTISTDHLTGMTTSPKVPSGAENHPNPVNHDDSIGRNDSPHSENQADGSQVENTGNTSADAGSASREVSIWALTEEDHPSVMAITDPSYIDSVEGLLRLTDREGLMFVPRLSGTLGRSGDANASARQPDSQNPLQPTFQRTVIRSVQEIAWRYGSHPSFGGIALDLSAGSAFRFGSPDAGLDTQTFTQFVQDTGFKVASECLAASDTAATWTARRLAITQIGLNGHTTWRTEWLLWRAGQLTRFYGQLADILRRVRPEARLWLTGYDAALEPICETPLEAGLHAALLQVDSRFFSSIFERMPIGPKTQTDVSNSTQQNVSRSVGTDCAIGYAAARRVEGAFQNRSPNRVDGATAQSPAPNSGHGTTPNNAPSMDAAPTPTALAANPAAGSTVNSTNSAANTMTKVTDFEPSTASQTTSAASTTLLRLQPIQDIARQVLCEMWAYHDIRIFCDSTFQGCFEMPDVNMDGENTQNTAMTSEKNRLTVGGVRRDNTRFDSSVVEESRTMRLRTLFRNFPTLPTERFRSPSPSGGQPVVLRWCSDGRSTWLIAINTSPFPVQAHVKLVAGQEMTSELLLSETAPQLQWSAGRLIWTVTLPPYMGEVVRFAEAEIPIDDYTVSWSTEIDVEIQRQIQRLGQRITEIANPPEWAFSENPGFNRTYADYEPVERVDSTDQEPLPAKSAELAESFQPILPGWRLLSCASVTSWKQVACSTSEPTIDISATDSLVTPAALSTATAVLPTEYERENQSLYLANGLGTTTLLSDPFPLPLTRRLTIHLRLRAANAASVPRIRVGLEGQTEWVASSEPPHTPNFRSSVVFDANDYQTTWNDLIIHITDPTGLTFTSPGESSSREQTAHTMAWLRIELLDPGAVELDEVRMDATALTRQEQTALFKQVAPASVFWSQRRLSDCMAILTGRVPEALENWNGYVERVAAGEQKPLRVMR